MGRRHVDEEGVGQEERQGKGEEGRGTGRAAGEEGTGEEEREVGDVVAGER